MTCIASKTLIAAEIAGEREVLAFELRFGGRRRFQVGPAGATNGFETTGDVYPFVELFGFEQAIVGGIKILALDVKTGQGEALAAASSTCL